MKYKNVIPELVSFETNLKSISGFNLSDNFCFFDEVSVPNQFNYKIIIDNNFEVPKSYDFRNGYYTKLNNIWYYYRNILGIIEFKFIYNVLEKTFTCNSIFLKVPFEIGGIPPVGKLIS